MRNILIISLCFIAFSVEGQDSLMTSKGVKRDTTSLLSAYKAAIATNTIAIAGKQGLITFTTTGTSGVATFGSNILNIPQYAGTTYTGTSPINVTGSVISLNTVPIANGGTGTTTPGLVAGTNITSITGAWPNQTINAASGVGAGTVTGGTITWPGTTYSTPTAGTVTSGNLNFSPALASQSAYTLLGNNTSGTATPSFFTNPYLSGVRRNAGSTAVEANINGTWITQYQDSTGGSAAWKLTGNAGTDTLANAVGTTDATPLLFKVKNVRAGAITDSITRNTSLGWGAMRNAVLSFPTQQPLGSANTAFGYKALEKVFAGQSNVAIGALSLNLLTTGSGNIAVGNSALGSASNMANAIAIGNGAMSNATQAGIGIGLDALKNATSFPDNIAIGISSLTTNTTGGDNVAIGFQSLTNSNSASNLAIGNYSLYTQTTGYQNIALGPAAMYLKGGSGENVAIGYNTFRGSGSGNQNTIIGNRAMYNNTGSGNLNVAIGYCANWRGSTNSGGVFIGNHAGNTETSSNKLYISNDSTVNLIHGDFSTGQVQINAAASPSLTTSAQFEIISTTKGFLKPRMTTTQKNAIASPAEGLTVYDLTLHQMSYYNGTAWINY